MGLYINKTTKNSRIGKYANTKIAEICYDGGKVIRAPREWQENLVCVVDNGEFGAALYCINEQEFQVASRPDGRPKTWIIYPNVKEVAE